ncbi:MFS transporter [Nocardiopsis sp. CC223A]|uniref:MFS transporter n=1 Tax=Nocardiopsis sp. CC223A TaxID=3044051 RepID=UPI00278C0968|nr:MFS transporter [Nocardiopsis sp. CC223A]
MSAGEKAGGHFPRFLAGSLSGNLADGIMFTALPLVAAALTNDPLLVSGLIVARFLPWLLFGLVVGVLVDRLDRGVLMVSANLVRAAALVALAALVATGHASIPVLYAVMFTVMTCEVFYDLAGRAMLPRLVPVEGLDRANGRIVGGKTVLEDFAGAPLAGLLFAVAAFLPLAVNAGAYLLGALVLLGLPLAVRRTAPEAAEDAPARPSVRAELRAGLSLVFGDRAMRSPIVLNVLANMAFMAQAGVLVLIVQEHFGVPEALYGVFLASSAVGALAGALLTARIAAALGRFRTSVLAFAVMGLACAAFGLAPGAYLAALAWGVLGAAMSVSNIVMLGCVQTVVPGTHLGRVMSCVQVLGFGLAPVGALLGGLLGRVELFYVPVAAGGLILLALLCTAPGLRRLVARADEAAAAAAAESAPSAG